MKPILLIPPHEFDFPEGVEQTSLQTRGRFFSCFRKTIRGLTCNKSPKMCRSKGSSGLQCCKKKCVYVLTDHNNCGMCGNKCRYSAVCCNGKCVNQSFSKLHCK
ncbi:hypothetical protein GIB67_026959 [Kingdonia uniflora]|uniref:Stigma-specific Stig1 family protein n=1 Tax=Kingdonia uniflora TaxID=39325 RepID=A0A7J7P257_9MAGN|nr:hypothetical protein GIB67_026959 [Kingdonia uniflora]